MSTMTLTGWGQPHDALSIIAPDATHLDYSHCETARYALEEIARAKHHDIVIGWSLGGQLAVRAVAEGLLKPKRLVLIAVPFQFVVSSQRPIGMKRDLYDKFRDNYARNAARTLEKAWLLIGKDDVHAERINHRMNGHNKLDMLQRDWLRWLEELNGFSCHTLDFSTFPPTLIIHGENDAVVSYEQHTQFSRAIPESRVVSFPGCGHAPHWHNAEAVKKAVAQHV